ncbi:unnamed protein product [Ilex paraguariensis]|uniref:Uncharacterized protein n=1 Tax=Ilex paraguariensis TaxID=185542 RepID=A0ABC8ST75_9AQUA
MDDILGETTTREKRGKFQGGAAGDEDSKVGGNGAEGAGGSASAEGGDASEALGDGGSRLVGVNRLATHLPNIGISLTLALILTSALFNKDMVRQASQRGKGAAGSDRSKEFPSKVGRGRSSMDDILGETTTREKRGKFQGGAAGDEDSKVGGNGAEGAGGSASAEGGDASEALGDGGSRLVGVNRLATVSAGQVAAVMHWAMEGTT